MQILHNLRPKVWEISGAPSLREGDIKGLWEAELCGGASMRGGGRPTIFSTQIGGGPTTLMSPSGATDVQILHNLRPKVWEISGAPSLREGDIKGLWEAELCGGASTPKLTPPSTFVILERET